MVWTIVFLLAILVIPTIFWVYYFRGEGVGTAFLFWVTSGFFTLIGAGLLYALLLIPVYAFGTTHYERIENLQALGSDSSIQGRFYFLGGGYVNEQRVLNYIIENNDGGFELREAPAKDSVIYERDGVTPQVKLDWDHSELEWLLPFENDHDIHYRFTIPPDSVLQNYVVDNQ